MDEPGAMVDILICCFCCATAAEAIETASMPAAANSPKRFIIGRLPPFILAIGALLNRHCAHHAFHYERPKYNRGAYRRDHRNGDQNGDPGD